MKKKSIIYGNGNCNGSFFKLHADPVLQQLLLHRQKQTQILLQLPPKPHPKQQVLLMLMYKRSSTAAY